QRRSGRQGNSGGETNEIDEGAAIEREGRNGARVDDGVEGCRFGAQERGVFPHDDAGGYRTDGERDIYADSFAGADGDVLALVTLEAVLFDSKSVAAGFKAGPLVDAIFIGDGFVQEIGALFGERDFRSGDDALTGVTDFAGEFAITDLSAGGRRYRL